MKLLPTLALLAVLSLVGCASAPKVTRAQVPGGERVSIPNRGLSVILPEGWIVLPKTPENTLFLAGADGGNLRLALISPPGQPKNVSVSDKRFQERVKKALQANEYTKITRSEVIQVSGVNAYVCAGSVGNTAESTLQVHLIHKGRGLLLVFFSSQAPVTKLASVQAIIRSLTVAP